MGFFLLSINVIIIKFIELNCFLRWGMWPMGFLLNIVSIFVTISQLFPFEDGPHHSFQNVNKIKSSPGVWKYFAGAV